MISILKTMFYMFMALSVCNTSSAATGLKNALVIGNGTYKAAPLRNPLNDAKDIARTLEKVGFTVMLKTNLSQSEMRAAIREFGREIRKGGTGLFYYAGHGMQIKGENYLIPVRHDIQEEDEIADQAIKLSLILDKMDSAGNKMNVVILDACRDNPFARSFRSSSKGLALVDGPTGTFIAYSTQPGATASDGDNKNGLYTQHLLNNIETPGLTIEQVFKRVRTQVMKDSEDRQVPWELSSLTGDDFYFLGQDGGLTPTGHSNDTNKVVVKANTSLTTPTKKLPSLKKKPKPKKRSPRTIIDNTASKPTRIKTTSYSQNQKFADFQQQLNAQVLNQAFHVEDEASLDAALDAEIKKGIKPVTTPSRHWRPGYTCTDLRRYSWRDYRNCRYHYRYYGRYW